MTKLPRNKNNNSKKYDIFTSEVPKSQNDEGAVVVICALLIGALVMLVASSSLVSNKAYIKSQTRNAAMNTTLSAAAQLCPKAECLQESVEVALNVLNEYEFYNGHKKIISNFNLEDLNMLGDDGYNEEVCGSDPNVFCAISEDGNLFAKLGYGRFIPLASDDTRLSDPDSHPELVCDEFCSEFIPTAGPWASEHPGLPIQVVSNAFSVSIGVREVTSVFSSFFGEKIESDSGLLWSDAVALSGSVEPHPLTVPFAIPVCALLNKDGNYVPEDVTRYDRIFTGINRYESGEPGSDTLLPGLLYNATSDYGEVTIHELNWNGKHSGCEGGTMCTSYMANGDHSEHYSYEKVGFKNTSPEAESLGDAFGVVGLPAVIVPDWVTNEVQYENFILDKFIKVTTPVTTDIPLFSPGLPFKFLKNGFTLPDSEEFLWNKLSNNVVVPFIDDDDSGESSYYIPAINSYLEMPQDLQIGIEGISNTDVGSVLHSHFENETCDAGDVCTNLEDSSGFPEQSNFRKKGFCPSRRVEIKCYDSDKDEWKEASECAQKWDGSTFSSGSHFGDTPQESWAISGEKFISGLSFTGIHSNHGNKNINPNLQLRVKYKDGVDESTPVLVAKIPVIGNSDSSALDCSQVGSEKIDETKEYEVVGSVNVELIDVSIKKPTNLQAPFKMTDYGVASLAPTPSGYPNVDVDGVIIDNEATLTGPNPWYFSNELSSGANPYHKATDCNMVVGRITKAPVKVISAVVDPKRPFVVK